MPVDLSTAKASQAVVVAGGPYALALASHPQGGGSSTPSAHGATTTTGAHETKSTG